MLNRLKVNKFLKLSPIFLFILFLIMMYLYSNKNITHASVIKVENKKINSSSELEGKKIINDGVTEMNEGNYKKALELFDKALSLLPETSKWSVYYNKGLLYTYSKEYQKAVDQFLNAVKLNPDCKYCYPSIGFGYSSLGHEEKALEYYNKSIQLNPEIDVSYNYRGWYYSRKNEYDKAIEDFKKSVEYKPTSITNNIDLIDKLITANRLDEAQNFLHKFVKIISKDDILNFEIYNDFQCDIFYSKKEYKNAIPFCEVTISDYNKYLNQGKELIRYERISRVAYFNLIDSYAFTHQYQKSLDTTYALLELAKKHNDKNIIIGANEEIKFLSKKLNKQ